MAVLFCNLDLLKTKRPESVPGGGGGERSNLLAPLQASTKTRARSAAPAARWTHWRRGCPAPPGALGPRGVVAGAAGASLSASRAPRLRRRARYPGTAGGAGCPAARKASVTITIAVRALRGGGTGNSDLSGPAAVAATAAFCVRSATAGNGRAPAGPSASSQRRGGRGAGHPSRRKGGWRKRQKTHSSLIYFYLFFSGRDYFCLKKITILKPKKLF